MTTKSSLSTNFPLFSLQSLLTFSVSHLLSPPSYLVSFYLSLFPCLYRCLPSYHIFNLSTLLCLLFVPSCAFSPPASRSALVFGSPLPAALPLLLYAWHRLPVLYSSATLTQCFIYLPFYPPTPTPLPLCLSVSGRIRFIYIQPVTSAMEIY